LGPDDGEEASGGTLCRHCGEAVSPPRRRPHHGPGERPRRSKEASGAAAAASPPQPAPRGLSSSDPAVDEVS
jgi:hypothetical protein